MDDDRFDAIVVGAGPAGITAAKEMAAAGLSVVVLERGQFPGAKNVWGGILYREPTEAWRRGSRKRRPWSARSSSSATCCSPTTR